MVTKAQKEAMSRYSKKVRQTLVRVNPDTEPEIARKLDEVANKSWYIKSLILADIRREKQGGEQ